MSQSSSTSMNGLCTILLGSHDDRVTLHHELAARVTRFISATCMVAGAMAILASSARQAPPLLFSGVSLLYISQALSPVALAGLHLLYLWIVLKLLVFDVPSHRPQGALDSHPVDSHFQLRDVRRWAAQGGVRAGSHQSQSLSSWSFILVYAAWAARDGCESVVVEGSNSLLRKYWMWADISICLFLVLDLYHWIPLPPHLTAKDCVVFMCLGFYFVVHRTIVWMRRTEFTSVYSAYLDAVTAVPSQIRGETDGITDALAARLRRDELHILDFGSGDGHRIRLQCFPGR